MKFCFKSLKEKPNSTVILISVSKTTFWETLHMGNSGLNHWIKSLIKRWRTKENKVKNLVMSLFVSYNSRGSKLLTVWISPQGWHKALQDLASGYFSDISYHSLLPRLSSLPSVSGHRLWKYSMTISKNCSYQFQAVSKNCSIQFICVPDTFLYLFIVVNKQTNKPITQSLLS